FFDFNRFGPNHSKVLFHCRFLFKNFVVAWCAFIRRVLPIRWAPLWLPVLRFQSFRSRSLQSSLSLFFPLFKNIVLCPLALYSSSTTDPLGATLASSSSISIVSVQITPKFSFIGISSFQKNCGVKTKRAARRPNALWQPD